MNDKNLTIKTESEELVEFVFLLCSLMKFCFNINISTSINLLSIIGLLSSSFMELD